jgi:hypothetical protein
MFRPAAPKAATRSDRSSSNPRRHPPRQSTSTDTTYGAQPSHRSAANLLKIRNVNFARQIRAVAFAAELLDEADKGMFQLSVADLCERLDQF